MFKWRRAQMRLEKPKEVEGEFPLNKAGRVHDSAGAARVCVCVRLCVRVSFHLAAGGADRPDTRWQGQKKRVKTGMREQPEVEELSGQTGVTALSDGGEGEKNVKEKKRGRWSVSAPGPPVA